MIEAIEAETMTEPNLELSELEERLRQISHQVDSGYELESMQGIDDFIKGLPEANNYAVLIPKIHSILSRIVHGKELTLYECGLAEILLEHQDTESTDKAIELLKNALEWAERDADQSMRLWVTNLLVEAYSQSNAHKHLESAIEDCISMHEALDTDNEDILSELYLQLGETQVKLFKLEDAEASFEKCVELSSDSLNKSDEILVKATIQLTELLHQKGEEILALQKIESIASKVRDSSEENPTLLPELMLRQAALLRKENGADARNLLYEADQFISASVYKDSQKLAYHLKLLGSAYSDFGNFDRAKESLSRSLDITYDCSKGEDKSAISEGLFSLIKLYSQFKMPEEMQVYFQKYLALIEQLDSNIETYAAAGKTAPLVEKLGLYEQADKLWDKLESLAKEPPQIVFIVNTLEEILPTVHQQNADRSELLVKRLEELKARMATSS